jgi:NAD+ diphosphatase
MDPAIITVPTFGDFALLAHNRRWKDGRFSAVAGFVELGESFETACQRELLEETGLEVRAGS